MKTIEINNETDKPILVSACRTPHSEKIYVHIGKHHGNEMEVPPEDYAIVEIIEREH